ncbi:MAG: hypothetical protein RL272_1176 [Candidatus Parcubacteria bacterium]|jgi:hypothetical protein
MKCAWKTCTNEISVGRRFCDVRCKRKFFVDKRRRELKQRAVAYKGGGCVRCGYAKCGAALAFHHREPGSKDFSLSGGGITRSWSRIRAELDKCELICANCHAEVHARQHAPAIAGSETLGEFGEGLSD